MISVAAFYLWLVKYSSYRKLVKIQSRQRAREDKDPSVKPAAEQEGLTLSSDNCLITPRKLPYKRNVDMKTISFWENVL